MNEKRILLCVKQISKYFKNHKILDSISFDIKQGEIIGLLGHNGAGKTTLLRILASILIPTKGEILFNREDIQKNPVRYRQIIGYLPEDASLYKKLTGKENLNFYGSFFSNVSENNIKEYLAYFNVNHNKRTSKYSKGMKKKILIIKSLLNNPKILIWDEPFDSLDIETRIKLRKIINSVKSKGGSIIISSHSLGEFSDLFDRIVILKKGKKVYEDDIINIKKSGKEIIDVYSEYMR